VHDPPLIPLVDEAPFPGSAAGCDVGRPQISRLSRVIVAGDAPGCGGTVPIKVSKNRTDCPLKLFGETFCTNPTTSSA